ncbi:lytic murein transglycosylase [Xanthomonas sp. LMG 8992]|uniref:lytic murein transglycosylase n=1 Tax=Xanthomonas sp. LMG 8992 TaxID=1591157 RepID=UPI001F013E4D|nr:lytic murein transglycosylase [Xanthomonas sp. LMG 8992]
MMRLAWILLLAAPCALAQTPPAAAPSAPDPAFATCVAGLRTAAAKAGVAEPSFDRFTAGLQPDPSVLPLLDAQPEFTTPIWDYLAGLVDSQRIDDGRAMLTTHRDLLAQVAQNYGVDPETVVAVWGVESDYGRIAGKRPLLVSLLTLSCEGRRQPFFRSELFALLKLLQAGDLRPEGLTGSWAGAFGHTQFMPSTYARVAVDGDGDGRRDLVASIPDALASTANYLKLAGWQSGQPWGLEVKLPAGFDPALAGRTQRRPLSDWRARGLTAADGGALPALAAQTPAAVLIPAGVHGPAFLVFRNYDAIYAYNAAESYALAIALLSDRLRGKPGLVAAWPTDDPGLGRPERRELQTLLLARGHAIGQADGAIGTATRRAIQAEQQRLGLQPADGRAGQRILDALRREAGGAPATPAPPPPQQQPPTPASSPAPAPASTPAPTTPPAPTPFGGTPPTAFRLPAAYPAFAQSPAPRSIHPMSDVPGLSTGDFHGYPSLLVETPHSTAAISLFGGQVLSFVPKGGTDALWLSPSAQPTPTPIRGGTPVCWPYFGRQGQSDAVPAHGFVRTVPWQLQDARREADGSLVLTLAPPDFDDLPLRLRMQLRIGATLEQRLVTDNVGTAPARFTQALHNYFRVADATQVRVQGLDGLDYLDKFENYATPHRQHGDWSLQDPRDPGRSDRIYTGAGGRYTLLDPGLQRRIEIATTGSRTLVAWNPGEAGAQKMADVGPHWRQFVCLEAANAGPEVIELAPGAQHVLQQTISVVAL